MNTTTTPRVEVTPEMLASIERDAKTVQAAGYQVVHVEAVNALALVERIRELEKRDDLWPEIISGSALLSRNGRWGTCVECPRHNGDVFPERCKHTDRADHRLSEASWQTMCASGVRQNLL